MLRYSLLLVFLGIFTVAQGQISEVEYQLNPLSTTESTSLLQIEQTSVSHIALKGSLRQLIAFLKGVNTSQISVSDKDNASSVPSKSFPYSKIHMDDEQATLEGFSLKDMLSVLSQLREIPILLHNKPQYVRTHPYDWKLPYYFDESLLKALAQYGFKAEIKRDNYPVFTVIRL